MKEGDLSRRKFLAKSASLVMVQVVAGCDQQSGSEAVPEQREALDPILSNEDFYQVSYGGVLSEDWGEDWSLQLLGLNEGDQELTLEMLKELGETVIEHTLECIGNRSYYAIGNALWGGIYLGDLLAALGLSIPADAEWIAFECGDGYRTSLPLSDLADGLFVAWSMNAEPLPRNHGEPLRVLIPGRFGMKNPKWLKSLSFVLNLEAGTWESVGWSQEATYKLHSYIHQPRQGDVVSEGGTDLLGSAFGGSAAIANVQVSEDRETWHDAEITYEGGPDVWTLWRYRWVPPGPGEHTIWVRAIDEHGNIQDAYADTDLDPLDGYDAVFKVVIEA